MYDAEILKEPKAVEARYVGVHQQVFRYFLDVLKSRQLLKSNARKIAEWIPDDTINN